MQSIIVEQSQYYNDLDWKLTSLCKILISHSYIRLTFLAC